MVTRKLNAYGLDIEEICKIPAPILRRYYKAVRDLNKLAFDTMILETTGKMNPETRERLIYEAGLAAGKAYAAVEHEWINSRIGKKL